MGKIKRLYRHRYFLIDRYGRLHISSDDEFFMRGEAEFQNLELREKLPNMKIGKKVIKNRFRILRRIKKNQASQQLSLL